MQQEICSRCHVEPRLVYSHSWCRGCRNEHQRENRTPHRLLPPVQRKRANARAIANVYQRRGKLKRKPCENCGAKRTEKHHDDYSKPLQVRWLCKGCHQTLHKTQ